MSIWERPEISALLLGGYFGLLSLLWGALILGTRKWGDRWAIHRPDLNTPQPGAELLVSICIPARDEEANIGACVAAALASRWSNLEVVVVDDRSSDGTAEAALAAGKDDPRLRVVAGDAPAKGWAGKPWACSRAAGEAQGQLIFFVDADVRLSPDTIPAFVTTMAERELSLLSAYGSWELNGLWERILIPTVGWLIRGAVDLDAVNDPVRTEAFANGQLIMVERNSYESMGGHGVVRDKILEDVRLAEQFKRRGLRIGMGVAPWAFRVRLYDSLSAIIQGYSKNLYEGMGRKPSLGLGAVFFIVIGSLAPWAALVFSLIARLSWGWAVPETVWIVICGFVCFLQILFRWCLEVRDGRSGAIAWSHPLSNIVLIWILLRSMFKMEASWKGRVFVDGKAL
jgi:hypothetical protein